MHCSNLKDEKKDKKKTLKRKYAYQLKIIITEDPK